MSETRTVDIDVHSQTWRSVQEWAEEYLDELSGELLDGVFQSLADVTYAQGQVLVLRRLMTLAKQTPPPAQILTR